MSDRVAAAAKVIAEYTNTEPDGVYATHLARALDAAGLLAPEMQEEWGVEDRWGYVTWFPLADYIAGASDESRRMAEEYAAGDDDYYLVHRYVTEVIEDD